MTEVLRDARSVANAQSNELNAKRGGMAGDDEAGQAFNSA